MKTEIVKFVYFPYKLVACIGSLSFRRYHILSPNIHPLRFAFPFYQIYLGLRCDTTSTLIENGFVKNSYMPILFGFRCRMRSFLHILAHSPQKSTTSHRHTFQIQRSLCQVDTYKKRNRWGFPTYSENSLHNFGKYWKVETLSCWHIQRLAFPRR